MVRPNSLSLGGPYDWVTAACSAPAGGAKPFTPSPVPNKSSPPVQGDNIVTKGMSAFSEAANPEKIPICAKCEADIRWETLLSNLLITFHCNVV